MEISKWNLPGWRIEQRYKNKVLIGNWNEERRQFQRGNVKSNSTNRRDFKEYKDFTADTTSRQSSMIKNDGLDRRLIFSHNKAYRSFSNNLISWYDQQFNGRETEESPLPGLRTWHGRSLTWAPEKSDHPLQGTPTRFGLLEKKQAKWKSASEGANMYQTTYAGSFIDLPKDSFVTRHFSTPKSLSSHFSPHTKINKDLDLRNATICTSQEHPPNQLLLSV